MIRRVHILSVIALLLLVPNYESVVIEAFVESLCPDCRRFIINSLKQYVQYNQPNLATVNIIPFGKCNQTLDKETSKYNFVCQHEDNECYGNTLETCAIGLLGKEKSYPLIICMFENIFVYDKNFTKVLDFCLPNNPQLVKDIKDCASSTLGNLYEHEMGIKTPPHPNVMSSVPWVHVDGVYNKEVSEKIIANLTEYVCSLPGNDCHGAY